MACERKEIQYGWTECDRCRALWSDLNTGYRPQNCVEHAGGLGAYNKILPIPEPYEPAAKYAQRTTTQDCKRDFPYGGEEWGKVRDRAASLHDAVRTTHYGEPMWPELPTEYDCVRVTQAAPHEPFYPDYRKPFYTLTEEQALAGSPWLATFVGVVVGFIVGFVISHWVF